LPDVKSSMARCAASPAICSAVLPTGGAVEADDLVVAAAEVLVGLLADEAQADLAPDQLLADEGLGALDDVGVERAGEAAVAGVDHHRHALAVALLEQRVRVGAGHLGQLADHVRQRRRVRPGRDDRVLGAAQLGRRDQLHGARDLAGVLDRPDALADGLQRRHVSSSSRPRTACRTR
jgi:hypothetical protein